MAEAFDAMVECATVVDATQTWQVVHGSGNHEEDNYEFEVVSRGQIPRLPDDAFGDLADSVIIDVDPEDDSHTTTHFVKYLGGLAGMQLFAQTLATDLNQGAEGDVNPISDFVTRNPLWLFNAALGARD